MPPAKIVTLGAACAATSSATLGERCEAAGHPQQHHIDSSEEFGSEFVVGEPIGEPGLGRVPIERPLPRQRILAHPDIAESELFGCTERERSVVVADHRDGSVWGQEFRGRLEHQSIRGVHREQVRRLDIWPAAQTLQHGHTNTLFAQ